MLGKVCGMLIFSQWAVSERVILKPDGYNREVEFILLTVPKLAFCTTEIAKICFQINF